MKAKIISSRPSQIFANLQREVMAMRQILMLLLAHHARYSAEANALGSLKDLLDEVYSSDAVEEEIRGEIDRIIEDANTLIKTVKGGSH